MATGGVNMRICARGGGGAVVSGSECHFPEIEVDSRLETDVECCQPGTCGLVISVTLVTSILVKPSTN